MYIQDVKKELIEQLSLFKEKAEKLNDIDSLETDQLQELINASAKLNEQLVGLKYLLEHEAKESINIAADEEDVVEPEVNEIIEDEYKEGLIEHIEEESSEMDSLENEVGVQEEVRLEEEFDKKPDLNEAFSAESDSSISNQLGRQPISDLLAAIGLNERYLYANELFNGDMEAFKDSIQALNECNDIDSATEYCKELMLKNDWDEENELYNALLMLIERRFQIS